MKKIKLFLDPIHDLSPWLEKQNAKGFRLKNIISSIYEFEPCDTKLHYSVQYIGVRSHKDVHQYIQFLRELEYRIFFAPINQGSFAFGKIRLRPYKKDLIATTFTNSYNKEILVVESTEALSEPLLSTPSELKEYYRQIKHTYFYGCLLQLLFILSLLYKWYHDSANVVIYIIALTLFTFLFIIFGRIYLRSSKREHISEQDTKLHT